MENKWEFDKDYIVYLLNIVNNLLKSRGLSKTRRKSLEFDKKALENFWNKNFSGVEEENKYNNLKLVELISITLKYMKQIYKCLGPELIDWIIELNNAKLFNFKESNDKSFLSMDEQAELVIKSYEKYSKFLLKEANYLLNINRNIQEVDDEEIISYCHNLDVIKIPFIIINPKERIHAMNHEIQHGIEHSMCYNSNFLYGEVGSILFELLCMDTFSQERGYLKSGDFDFRLEDTRDFLEDITDFLLVIREFAKRKFDISYAEFIDAFEKIVYVPKEELKDYLAEDILDNDGFQEMMMYTFSFLKAIELRQTILNKKVDAIKVLDPYISRKKFRFNINSDAFNIYNNYVEEMNSRVRKR